MVRRPLALCCCPIVSTLWILHRLLVASDRPGLATVRIRIPHSSSQRPDWRRAGSPSATARRRRTSSTGHRRLAAGTARSSSPIERAKLSGLAAFAVTFAISASVSGASTFTERGVHSRRFVTADDRPSADCFRSKTVTDSGCLFVRTGPEWNSPRQRLDRSMASYVHIDCWPASQRTAAYIRRAIYAVDVQCCPRTIPQTACGRCTMAHCGWAVRRGGGGGTRGRISPQQPTQGAR